MSLGAAAGMRADFDVEMKLRDGVILRADVYRPATDGPVPAILQRTPYNKELVVRTYGLGPLNATRAGYAYVVQDVRGRWASEGEYSPISTAEAEDGYDCVEWLAAQDWCDGTVGMVGASYESLTQLMAATEQPPSLKAIVPEFSGDPYRGSLMLDSTLISWAASQAMDWVQKQLPLGNATVEDLAVVMRALFYPQEAAQHLPLADLPLMKVGSLPSYAEMLALLRSAALIPLERIGVPLMMVGGWYDIDPIGCERIFREVKQSGDSDYAREHTSVIWGPWEHGYVRNSVGEGDFGLQATGGVMDLAGIYLAFFDKHLRGLDTEVPVARYFLTGVNEWHTADAWPPTDATWQTLHLSAGSTLSPTSGAEESIDSFDYDPHDPVPSFGGRFFRLGGSLPGMFDQRRVEERADVLVYTGPILEQPLQAVGDARFVLRFATSATDTDLAVKLCDFSPDGLSLNVADNFVRLRFRDGMTPKFIEPGVFDDYVVELGPIGHVFAAGHQVRVQVTSSCFPHYDRNMNTGNPEGTDAVGVVAHQQLALGGTNGSRLELQTVSSP